MKPALPPLLAHGLLTLAVVAIALFGYDRMFAQRAPRVGVIDLNAVYREKEAEFTRQVTQARSETERDDAMQEARTFAQRLPLALEGLSEKCRCVVLLSNAVVTPTAQAIDLTPELRRQLSARERQ
ncbi:TrbI F-type domain-containing protein [Xanthomonas hortorum]|uniref:TrbI F-type domain-containing protein n=1 Tax=Xanthomonas hortorum pv. hederae TaxID=453603 RepID=A0A9X3YYZ1_9XANT|nr:TrbI F-type domain-containing protein [Xanthomonas hortorum]MCE4369666.1 TrbI F-type domain-containing protein [Xanthomonas hortorum pv. hederae]MDC8637164.1 TrbI F-type domain-containing protein [Xanthomonas hortorum pv. hederae]PPU86209.1 hypothetical protein XhhCFBP4925_00300 [Xanthomonas hortorum pv. hederae]PUF01272.1 hypothetical protein C7T87_04265 [Xanthomonas hortorum pv. hederae]